MTAMVQKGLGALSPQQRMVFVLRHYEGRTMKEIARTMRCAEGTVKRYLFTATRRMREELRELL
jgi:RNA polymerase sigma-70 factor (ECF subfamily)